jgi:hypothetical protein
VPTIVKNMLHRAFNFDDIQSTLLDFVLLPQAFGGVGKGPADQKSLNRLQPA